MASGWITEGLGLRWLGRAWVHVDTQAHGMESSFITDELRIPWSTELGLVFQLP